MANFQYEPTHYNFITKMYNQRLSPRRIALKFFNEFGYLPDAGEIKSVLVDEKLVKPEPKRPASMRTPGTSVLNEDEYKKLVDRVHMYGSLSNATKILGMGEDRVKRTLACKGLVWNNKAKKLEEVVKSST